jgi:nitrogen fixation negative regulator NifL
MTTTPTVMPMEAIPAIIYVADENNRIHSISPLVEGIVGTPVHVWLNDSEAWARHIHPEDRDSVLASMAASRRDGTPFHGEYRMIRADGTIVWLLDEARQVRDAGGAMVTHGVALDITERKQAEASAGARTSEERTLHRISEIALSDRPLDEACQEVVRVIAAATGFGMVAICLYDEAQGTVHYKCTHGLPDVLTGVRFRLDVDESFSAAVIRTGRPFVWTSADPLPPFLHETLRSLGIRSFVTVPMTVGRRVIGALGIADREALVIPPALVDLAASVGNHVAALIERAEAQEAQRASERQFRAVFDATLDAMVVINDSRTYVAANPAAGRLFGTPVDQLLGRRFGDFAAPGTDLERLWARGRDGGVSGNEWSLVRQDGTTRIVESTMTSNFQPGRHLFVIRDLTDIRRALADSRVRAAALSAAANSIVITDAEGRIEWVNPEFTRTTGYTLDEIRGQTPRLLKSGHHDARFYEGLWASIRRGAVWRGDMVNRRKDGSVYHEEQSITPVFEDGPGGRIEHFVAVKQDISERKRAEAALRRSEEYYRSLIESVLDIIVVLDAEGIVRYASPSVHASLGYRPEEMVGTSALERLHPDDAPAVSALFFGSQATPGFAASAEYRSRHRDGSWRIFEGVGRNLLDHPSVAGIIINARDVTDRRRDEATQQRLREQLTHSEKLAAMSELLAGVAHELNNPLSVVIGHTALLAHTADATVGARAEKIARAAERCGRIVKNFLALARQYPPERTAVDLNQVVRDALEVMAYALRVDDVEVVTELDPTLASLSADAHQLQQVVINLVSNAHQAMRGADGPRRLTLSTGTEPATGRVWLEVTDSGPGIAPEVEARLFEPFFTTKPIGQGTGLGLPICRGIIEGHGGQLSVGGGTGRGATFRAVLPVGAPATTTPPSDDHGPVVTPRRILVVDDEREIAAVVSELLRRDGHDVTTAANGKEALAQLAKAPFDAVVSDIRMPHMDGPALWHAVKQQKPALADRFVFFTGDTLSATTAEFLARTAAPSLKKPFALRDVRLALAHVPVGAAGV